MLCGSILSTNVTEFSKKSQFRRPSWKVATCTTGTLKRCIRLLRVDVPAVPARRIRRPHLRQDNVDGHLREYTAAELTDGSRLKEGIHENWFLSKASSNAAIHYSCIKHKYWHFPCHYAISNRHIFDPTLNHPDQRRLILW